MIKSKIFILMLFISFISINSFAQTFTLTQKPLEGTIAFGTGSITLAYEISYQNCTGPDIYLEMNAYINGVEQPRDGDLPATYYLTFNGAGVYSVRFEIDEQDPVGGIPKPNYPHEEFNVTISMQAIVQNNFPGGKVYVFTETEEKNAPYTATFSNPHSVFVGAVDDQNDGAYDRIWNTSEVNHSEWKEKPLGQMWGVRTLNKSFLLNEGNTDKDLTLQAEMRKICNTEFQISQEGTGMTVTHNGNTFTIPPEGQTFSVIESNPITATAVDGTYDGIDYYFQSWSDGSTSRTKTFNPSSHQSIHANYIGYPNTSMMNVQNNITTVGAAPEITWTDNPNNNVSYKIQTRRYNSEAGYWEPWSSYISVAKGVGYFRKIGSVVTNNASGDGLNIKLEAYYSTENTMSLNAMNTTFNYTCLDCGGPNNESKLNAGIQKDQVITKYAIANYPNPFNPTTVINYQVPEAGHVTVKVYDVMGKEIATLVDGAKNKGSYNINFSMDQYHLSSGIYFCRMQSGKNITTTKMILSK